MDDALEIPRSRADNIQEGDDHSSGDEDAGLDWTRLPKPGAAARPIIPKRGEKDFEPAPGGGSGLQLHILDRSRDAMFEALRSNRTISSKSISYGIWYPSIDRVHITTARGIHFSTMGHSVFRADEYGNPEDGSEGLSSKLPKRLELLPEEALYLIERGALFCYKTVCGGVSLVDPSNHELQSPGAPMSVQQAYAEMIGREGVTLERYQVYAYLKRLGFILMRAEAPMPEYPIAPAALLQPSKPQTLMQRLAGLLSGIVSSIVCATPLFRRIDRWKRPQIHQQKTTQGIFRVLRYIPCGHAIPLHRPPVSPGVTSKLSPYKIFFHAYKPSTPFRKTAPASPDFYLVVVNARTTAIPSLQELTALFDILPEMPLPPPRKRNILAPAKQPVNSQPTTVHPMSPKTEFQEGSSPNMPLSQPKSSWTSILLVTLQRLFHFLPPFRAIPVPNKTKPSFTPPKPNPFLALKTGKKTVVIAAVDGGNISLFRFGQGVFEDWPMV